MAEHEVMSKEERDDLWLKCASNMGKSWSPRTSELKATVRLYAEDLRRLLATIDALEQRLESLPRRQSRRRGEVGASHHRPTFTEGTELMDKHTPECERDQREYAEAVAKYERDHPNHCRACSGRGGAAYRYDPSPAGVALSPGWMWDFEPCPECVEQGKCPRCGFAMLLPSEDGGVCEMPEKCAGCGWDDKAGGKPLAPECWCEEIRAITARIPEKDEAFAEPGDRWDGQA